FTQEMRGQNGRVSKRLVEPAGDLRQKLVNRIDGKRLLAMVGPQVKRDGSGVATLVEARIFKTDGERSDLPSGFNLTERSGDARGINATGEKNADGDVGAPVARHRIAQRGPEPLGRGLETERIVAKIRRLPVSPDPGCALFPAKSVPPGE